jgi:hypothetical protein
MGHRIVPSIAALAGLLGSGFARHQGGAGTVPADLAARSTQSELLSLALEPAPSGASAEQQSQSTSLPAHQPKEVAVPSSSMLTVRMIDGVDSAKNNPGELFHASLETPLMVENEVVVPRGTDIYVRLTDSRSSGRYRGKSELHLELVKMEFQGRSYPLASSTYSVTGSSQGAKTAKKVGAGAAIGAVIGAVAGGGKGAAIGAGVGAAAGGAISGAKKGQQVKIPAETRLDFELEQPVTVTVIPHPASGAEGQQ